jgi:hypothetical protein
MVKELAGKIIILNYFSHIFNLKREFFYFSIKNLLLLNLQKDKQRGRF